MPPIDFYTYGDIIMQIVNTLLLTFSTVLILFAGVTARRAEKGHALRTVFGALTPLLLLSLSYLLIEGVIAGYNESAELLGEYGVPANYLAMRYAFTAMIAAYFLLTALSAAALLKRDKISPAASFIVLSAAALTATGAAILISERCEESVVLPIACAYALAQVFALACTLLDTEHKGRRVTLYVMTLLYVGGVAVALWYLLTSAFAVADEMGGVDAVGILTAVPIVAVIAVPAAVCLCSLVSYSVRSFKYVPKSTVSGKSANNKG